MLKISIKANCLTQIHILIYVCIHGIYAPCRHPQHFAGTLKTALCTGTKNKGPAHWPLSFLWLALNQFTHTHTVAFFSRQNLGFNVSWILVYL